MGQRSELRFHYLSMREKNMGKICDKY